MNIDKNIHKETQEIDKKLRGYLNIKDLCMYPDHSSCSGPIIRCHSIQNSRSLDSISKNGHVLSFVLLSLFELEKNKGVIELKKVSKNKVTTFFGFCQKHDSELFKPIELFDYKGEEIQNFLFAYRALSKEVYVRINMLKAMQEFSGHPFMEKNIYDLFMLGFRAGTRDLVGHKALFDNSLMEKNYGDVMSYRISTNLKPNILVSSIFYPEYTVNGLSIQNLADISRFKEGIQITIFPNRGTTEILFTWHKNKSQAPEILIGSIDKLNEEEKLETITQMIFSHCENIVVSPEWWENISSDRKKKLIETFNESMDIRTERKPDYLTPHGFNIFSKPARGWN
ncbi:MAG: hypothetical protein KJI70_00290 [Patescibacteria group bacterium]|nr:hypothetical protein [Patescibacteria group bacterium]